MSLALEISANIGNLQRQIEQVVKRLDEMGDAAEGANKKVEESAKDAAKGQKGLADSLTKIPGPAKEIGEKFNGFKDVMSNLGGVLKAHPLLALAGVVAAAGAAAVKVAADFAETAVALDKQAKFAGMSTEAFSRYRTFAQGAGLETEELSEVFAELATKQQDATDSNSEQAAIFKTLGINIKDAQGNLKGTDQLFGEVADSIQKMGVNGTTTDAAMRLFGDDLAKKVLPALQGGSAAVEQFKQKNDELGLTLKQDSVDAAKQYKEAMASIDSALTAMKENIGSKILPALASAAQFMSEFFGAEPKGPSLTEQIKKLEEELTSVQGKLQSAGQTRAFDPKEVEALARRYAQLTGQIKVLRGELEGAANTKPPKGVVESKGEADDKKKGDDKASKDRTKAKEEEARRQEQLNRLLEQFEKAEISATIAALDGAEKINATHEERVRQIEIQRAEGLKLAKTDKERAKVNSQADQAIIASRKQADDEIKDLQDKAAEKEKKRLEDEVEDSKKAAEDKLKADKELKEKAAEIRHDLTEDTMSDYDKIVSDYQSTVAKLKELYGQDYENNKEYQDLKAAADKKFNRDVVKDSKKTLKQVADLIEQITSAITDAISDAAGRMVDEHVDAYEEIQDELDDINDEIESREGEKVDEMAKLSDEELAKKKADLEAKAAAEKEAALEAFKVQQAAQMAQAIISTALAVVKFLADPGGYVGVGLSIAAGIAGAASIAAIASTPPPSFHSGGVIIDGPSPTSGAVDDVLIRAKKGEAVLTDQGVKAAGGARGVASMNRGQSGDGQTVAVSIYNRRIVDRVVIDSMKLGGTAKRSVQRASSIGQTKGHSNRA